MTAVVPNIAPLTGNRDAGSDLDDRIPYYPSPLLD
jgi:hypothetical protein